MAAVDTMTMSPHHHGLDMLDEHADRRTTTIEKEEMFQQYLDDGTGYRKDNGDTSKPATLLVSKTRAALKIKGYNMATADKVAALVEKNVLGVYITNAMVGNHGRIVADGLTDMVEKVFRNALMEQRPRFNSNEPALLITLDDVFWRRREPAEQFVQHVLAVLRNEYSIRPVRIYVIDDTSRRSLSLDADRDETGVGLALLNVVNTDIGGPSMIELLDHDHARPEWQQSVIMTEAWRDHDFLWRNDDGWKVLGTAPTLPAAAEERPVETFEAIDEADFADADLETASLSEDGISPTIEASSLEDSDDNMVSGNQATPVQHAAMTDLMAQEAARGHITHPTWSRVQDDISLAELIRSQASVDTAMLPNSDEAFVTETTVSVGRRDELADEEEFEVV